VHADLIVVDLLRKGHDRLQMEEEAIVMRRRPLQCESLLLAATTTEEGDVSGAPQIWISLLLTPEGDMSDDGGLGGGSTRCKGGSASASRWGRDESAAAAEMSRRRRYRAGGG
jgi:hypothetical protein